MQTLSRLALVVFTLCGSAQAACTFELEVRDALSFSQTELVVESSCESVTLNLAHTGQLSAELMGHNWVLTRASDVMAVVDDGVLAGLDNGWIKPGDDRVIAHTGLIGGGESDSITFMTDALDINGDYTFFCSALGHWQAMQGRLIFR